MNKILIIVSLIAFVCTETDKIQITGATTEEKCNDSGQRIIVLSLSSEPSDGVGSLKIEVGEEVVECAISGNSARCPFSVSESKSYTLSVHPDSEEAFQFEEDRETGDHFFRLSIETCAVDTGETEVEESSEEVRNNEEKTSEEKFESELFDSKEFLEEESEMHENEEDVHPDISISFRQVNTFNLELGTFMFFGLTSQPIFAGFSFEFFINFISGELQPTLGKAKCEIGKEIPEIVKYIMPVYFNCKIENPEGVKFESIEIQSSDNIVGLPTDKTLLNPKLTDEAIEAGRLTAITPESEPPKYVQPPKIDTSLINQGILMFTFGFEGEMGDIEGKTFSMKLEDLGIELFFIIMEIKGNEMIVKCEIGGKVDGQSLNIEQTVIMVNGEELFVMPEFKTEPITTEGFNSEEGESSDQDNSDEEKQDENESGKSNEEKPDEEKSDENKEKTEEEDENKDSQEKEDEASQDTTEIISSDKSSEEKNGTEPMTKEEAEERAKISISFRQLQGFSFVGGTISFDFYALVTQSLSKGQTIILMINLIGKNGMEEEPKDITCKLENDVEVKGESQLESALFKCSLSGLDESQGYTSLRLNSSDDVAGIPFDDETLLNPVLTEEAIANNELKDCSKDSSVPPLFTYNSMEDTTCKTDGKFTMKGSISNNAVIVSNKFTISLTYPEGASIICTFNQKNLECIADRELGQDGFVIEQTIITEGPEEIFIMKSISVDNMDCKNGLLLKAEEKKDLKISFRQVSHIQSIPNGLSFFFAAFINAAMQASNEIKMNVIVTIDDKKVDKEATCVLLQNVDGSGTQGDFNCTVTLEEGEKAAPENLTVSTNNDNIGGCAELEKEEASPKLTDEAIEDSENAVSDLGVVPDFSLEKEKNKKPPTFTLGNLDLTNCEEKGKLKITGKFSEKIEEEMTFELPFTFPASKIKCTIEQANENEEVELTCKMQKVKKFAVFKNFVLEPRLLKKKCMEMLFIKGSSQSGKETSCKNFNEYKLERARHRKDSPFSFLQMGRPAGYSKLFFMAITKKSNKNGDLRKPFHFPVTLMHPMMRRRVLDNSKLEEENLEIDCQPSEAYTAESGTLDCEASNGSNKAPSKVEINDDSFSGVPDEANVETDPKPDYSNKTELENFDKLPVATITGVSSKNCVETGKYTITANLEGQFDFDKKENIKIPFASPDSSGLCVVNVKGSTLQIDCENKEQFSASEIILPAQTIYDEDGTTPLFKTKTDYTAPTQFSCAISDLSVSPSNIDKTTSGTARKIFHKNQSSGLSGGAIVAIILSIVAACAIVGILVALNRKGARPPQNVIDPTTDTFSAQKFTMNVNNPNTNVL